MRPAPGWARGSRWPHSAQALMAGYRNAPSPVLPGGDPVAAGEGGLVQRFLRVAPSAGVPWAAGGPGGAGAGVGVWPGTGVAGPKSWRAGCEPAALEAESFPG